jgi:hypothetical protein
VINCPDVYLPPSKKIDMRVRCRNDRRISIYLFCIKGPLCRRFSYLDQVAVLCRSYHQT